MRRRTDPSRRRGGTTTVELAVILPVFFLFMFTLIEFSHSYLISNALGAATRKAARYGSCDGITTAATEQKAVELITKAMKVNKATVVVKDASVFDSSSVDPSTINYSTLPAIELKDASPRKLFIVRAEVNYADVALLPPFWLKTLKLSGQSVMRHE